jgi:hypothetical protein
MLIGTVLCSWLNFQNWTPPNAPISYFHSELSVEAGLGAFGCAQAAGEAISNAPSAAPASNDFFHDSLIVF